jgi:hypothetical protein
MMSDSNHSGHEQVNDKQSDNYYFPYLLLSLPGNRGVDRKRLNELTHQSYSSLLFTHTIIPWPLLSSYTRVGIHSQIQ